MSKNDYSASDTAPDTSALAKLSVLATDMHEAEVDLARLESELRLAQERYDSLAQVAIPDLMDEVGVERFTTTSGLEITVARKVRASIPKMRREEAYAWLDRNGHGGLIKRSVAVAFRRDQQADAEQLAESLQGRFPNVAVDQKVESSTLAAFAREQLDLGAEIPMDLFGIVEFSEASIKTKRSSGL